MKGSLSESPKYVEDRGGVWVQGFGPLPVLSRGFVFLLRNLRKGS